MNRHALALLALLASVSLARADLVSYDFTATTEVVYGVYKDALGLAFHEPIKGNVTYESSAIGSPLSDGWLVFTTPGRITLQIGGHTFASDPAGSLRIENQLWAVDPFGGGSHFEAFNFSAAPADLGLIGGPVGGSRLGFSAFRGGFVPLTSAGSLPSDLLPGQYGGYEFSAGAYLLNPNYDPSDVNTEIALSATGYFSADALTLAEAPEPGSLALAGIGAGLAVLCRRRRPNRGEPVPASAAVPS